MVRGAEVDLSKIKADLSKVKVDLSKIKVDLSKGKVDPSKVKGGSGEPADDTEGQDDGGVRHGRRLLAFTEAVMTNDREAIEQSRNALEAAIGPAGIIDTAAVIAMFNVVDRVADSTGIPIDAASREFRYGVGQELGMTHLTPEARAR